MALGPGPRLETRLQQQLVMTPQLQQAIKLLQMSNLELTTYIEGEIEQNPLLELENPEGGLGEEAAEPAAAATNETGGEDPPEAPDSAELANAETLLENDQAALDTDYENSWDVGTSSDGAGPQSGDSLHWDVRGAGGGEDGEQALENIASGERNLRDHLIEQANVDLIDPIERMVAVYLIDQLDEAGWLTGGLDPVVEALGCDRALVERVLARVRGFDPPGVFAHGLADCLGLQLADRGRLDEPMQALLDNLGLLAHRDFTALRKLCKVDTARLARMIDEIRSLDPKPATQFEPVVAQPVVPDVFIRLRPDGDWAVELNADALPRVLVNRRYLARVSSKARNKQEKEYLVDRLNSANWLVKSLHQRQQTILKVAAELVRQQEEFFTDGVEHLRPLTLKDVAEAISVHESTVSRVTSNKYIGMSRGIYEMKYFFTSSVGAGAGGDLHSAEAIRFRIKGLIDRESVDDVLSDDKIVDILRRDGVEIARRTVAKYRETLQIPSSVQRRREKTLHL